MEVSGESADEPHVGWLDSGPAHDDRVLSTAIECSSLWKISLVKKELHIRRGWCIWG